MKHPGHQLGPWSLQYTLNGTQNAARDKVLAGDWAHHGKKKPSRCVLDAETRGSHLCPTQLLCLPSSLKDAVWPSLKEASKPLAV